MTFAGPLALTGPLPAWDIELRRTDITQVAAWVLDRLRAYGHEVSALETLHEVLTPEQARAAARDLTAQSLCRRLRGPLHRLVAQALPELPLQRVWIQTRAHLRILLPGDELAAVPAHTDFGFGHSLSERNLWLALTDAAGSGALHLCPLRESLSWLAQTGRLYGQLDEAPALRPFPAEAGQLLLFTPLHLHRARPPRERARVSIDVRLLPAGDQPDLSFSPLWMGP